MANSQARHRPPQACRPAGTTLLSATWWIAQEAKWDGWWEAVVLARDGDMLTLKWRDYDDPNNLGAVALLRQAQ
jgi:hypothetical protein